MPKENKATVAQFEARVNKVIEMLILGLPRASAIQYVTNSTDWNVSDRQVDNYIAEANKEVEKYSQTVRERELGKAIRRLEMLFQSCMKVQDYQRALAVQKELNELLGLKAPVKQELSGRGGSPIQSLNVNVEANNADQAASILDILARAGAIPTGAFTGDNSETE